MRPASTLVRLAACLSSFAPIAAAWAAEPASIAVRADETTATGTAETEQTAEPTTTGGKQPKTTNLNTAKVETGDETGTGTEKPTATGKKKATGKKTKDNSRETFAPNDPPGGVSMTEPAAIAQGTNLYKIGDYVTLGWNYTSLQGTPTAIDVLVSCSFASETWTLTSNMTFETAVSYVWNTNDQNNNAEKPLPEQEYTLIIKDSEAAITDMPDPGYLGSFSQFTFGLYQPRGNTPLPEWTCPNCNSASFGIERQAIGFVLTMSLVTVASFTWFVTGLGLH